MRLVADSRLWITGPTTAATPLAAVLEVSGAVLSWTIDGPSDDAATQITFTDLSRADWLWRIVGDGFDAPEAFIRRITLQLDHESWEAVATLLERTLVSLRETYAGETDAPPEGDRFDAEIAVMLFRRPA